ncbi:hypothetical protein C0Q70_14039 [Pomacea canaliculata]|uniref:Uncharacterized protein n=1 Tax=Pomacea canaliculata TaxID=400727 RepID=A0A2T7NYW1_POMCA|nr:hypothetical protein C0Q70_14039 [Pomacea canaliculata]
MCTPNCETKSFWHRGTVYWVGRETEKDFHSLKKSVYSNFLSGIRWSQPRRSVASVVDGGDPVPSSHQRPSVNPSLGRREAQKPPQGGSEEEKKNGRKKKRENLRYTQRGKLASFLRINGSVLKVVCAAEVVLAHIGPVTIPPSDLLPPLGRADRNACAEADN